MKERVKLKRALISVFDKTGIVELAQYLQLINCEIISTGGTKKILDEAGISTIDIQSVTGNPEAFNGRMKTISFQIESAILFDREKDKVEAEKLNITAIDLVVCNLYPFQKVLEQGGSFDQLIENIDIGGPTMIRSAAKNFKYVNVLTDPSTYKGAIAHFKENDGSLLSQRQLWMSKAYNHTADYEMLIADTMDGYSGKNSIRLAFTNGKELRYGENSHQQAFSYELSNANNSLSDIEILNGKALSYNNILDINAAVESIKDLIMPSCAIVKHSNPCGLASSGSIKDSLTLAWAGDPISAFGSIISFNRKPDLNTLKFFGFDQKERGKRKFIEVIIAPDFDEESLVYLKKNKNLRVLKLNIEKINFDKEYRFLNGTLLVQDTNSMRYKNLESVSSIDFNIENKTSLVLFGLNVIKHLKSNCIAIVRKVDKSYQLLGMGAGQPNRLIATKLALDKARENLHNEYQGKQEDFEEFVKKAFSEVILLSDAFFPFPDNVELAGEAGIKYIVQPGGSINDKSVIAACNQDNIAMLFTGIRHFKH